MIFVRRTIRKGATTRPFASTQGNIEALLDGVHPTDVAHLAVILDESKVLARLIENLRTLSLAEAESAARERPTCTKPP